jgi:hypothetical protein
VTTKVTYSVHVVSAAIGGGEKSLQQNTKVISKACSTALTARKGKESQALPY